MISNEMKRVKFLKFVDSCEPTTKQRKEIVSKFDKIMNLDSSYYNKIQDYMDECSVFDDYDYNELDEEINNILVKLNYNYEKKDNDSENDVMIVDENLEKKELPDEEIELINVKPSILDRLLSIRREKDYKLPEEEIEIIEEKRELPEEDIIIEDVKQELPEEDIDIIEHVKQELPEEEIEMIEKKKIQSNKMIDDISVKTKKENKIAKFFKNLFGKKALNDLGDNDIPLIEKSSEKNKFNNFKVNESLNDNNIKINNKDIDKMFEVENYIKNNYNNNNEINNFINLIKFREDRENIINKLYGYIIGTKDKISEEEFLNELHNIFGISKKEKEEKIKSSNSIKDEISESERQRIAEVNKKYQNIKNELFNELDEYEKAFVEDMNSEGLKLGDVELDQMFNERTINKTKIYKYLLEIEKNNILYTYEKLNASLDEYEKAFVEDMCLNNIKLTDPEFNQMINERCVNKKSIIKYYEELNNINNVDLEKSNRNIQSIIDDYKKHIYFESSIDLKEKKLNELKQIAKERKLEKFSKMNKQQLIDALNQLTELKKIEADRQLELVK